MTTFAENASVDHQIENVYKTAADLFEPNTVLNTEDEYMRGVIDLVQRLLGMDDGDKEDIAQNISEGTGVYRLTAADFGTGVNGDLLYIGPFAVAQDFFYKNDNTATFKRDIVYGVWRVELMDGNSFGVGDTLEMAWRYAMAAEFGPIDDGFVLFFLK